MEYSLWAATSVIGKFLAINGWVSNLLVIFLVSALLRLAVAIMSIKPLKEVREVEPISHHDLFQELPLIKPMMDVIGRSIGHQP